MENNKPIIGILLGDPSGIGPELISKLLQHQEVKKANILIIGEKNVLYEADKLTGFNSDLEYVSSYEQVKFNGKNKFFLDISEGKNHSYEISKTSSESGQSVLNALNYALDLAKTKKIDAINFAPFNKTSMKLGGSKYQDELHLMADRLNVKNFFCEYILFNLAT